MLSFTLPNLRAGCASSVFLIKSCSAPITSSSPPAAAAVGADQSTSLEHKFGRKGIRFLEPSPSSGGNGVVLPTVELTVRNGSSVKVQIPTAHVTSYRPQVYWKDDGFEELLYTLPNHHSSSSSSSSITFPAPAASRGGIALVLNEVSDPNSKASSPLKTSEWTVEGVDSDSIDALQVELSCSSGTLELTYVITLYPMSIATAVMVKNNGNKAVNLAAAILTHFVMKRRGGVGIEGLMSCSYCTLPPLAAIHEILSPSEALRTEEPGWFSFGWEPEKKQGEWAVQDDKFTVLKRKMSRVYATPPADRLKEFYNSMPSRYVILDQGRELFFRVVRMGGFEDIYLCGPGSLSDKYGKDYFICTGPASMLVPVVVKPGDEWRGAQVVENDNLF